MAFWRRGGRVSPLSLVLDDFSAIRQVQPLDSDPRNRDLWIELSFNSTTPLVSVDATVPFQGGNSLKCTWNGATANGAENARSWQFYLNTYTLYHPDFPVDYNGWHWANEFTEPFSFQNQTWGPQWGYNGRRINRFEFWMKPPDVAAAYPGSNFQFGTFLRKFDDPLGSGTNESVYDSKRGHFYHFVDFAYRDGVWQKVIIDTHPQYQVFNPDWVEIDMNDVWAGHPEAGYMDQLTNIYWDLPYLTNYLGTAWSGQVNLAGMRFYEETATTEDVVNIATPNGCYQPISNTIHFQWQHKKSVTPTFDVRYAWTDVGWASATGAPSGTGIVSADATYLTVNYDTTAIDITGHSSIWMYVQKQGETTYRKFEILLGSLS